MHNILCSNCGAEYDLDKDDISADLKCPRCGHNLRLSGTKLVKKDLIDDESKAIEEMRRVRRLFDRISWAGVFTGFFVILSIFALLRKTQFDSAALFFIGPLVGGFVSGYRGIDEYIEGAINGFLVSFLLFILVLLGLIFIFITDGPFSASASMKIVFTLILMLAVGLSGSLSGVFIKKVEKGIHSSENTKIGKGYLVCDKCGGYYKLQLWESPDDFDKCQCGGNLEYHEDNGELESYEDDEELEMIRD